MQPSPFHSAVTPPSASVTNARVHRIETAEDSLDVEGLSTDPVDRKHLKRLLFKVYEVSGPAWARVVRNGYRIEAIRNEALQAGSAA